MPFFQQKNTAVLTAEYSASGDRLASLRLWGHSQAVVKKPTFVIPLNEITIQLEKIRFLQNKIAKSYFPFIHATNQNPRALRRVFARKRT